MQNITPVLIAFAVLSALAGAVALALYLPGFFHRRREARMATERQLLFDISSLRTQLGGISNTFEAVRTEMKTRDEALRQWLQTTEKRLPAEETVVSMTEAVREFKDALMKLLPVIEKQSDNVFLVARGAMEMKQAVQALRMVVFGDRRAEEFGVTRSEAEDTDKANLAFDIDQLMLDHNLSRREAEKRVMDAYAHVSRNSR